MVHDKWVGHYPKSKKGHKEPIVNTEENLPANAPGKTTKRISVSLSPDTVEKLRSLASAKHISFTEALRQSVLDEVYFQEEIAKGGKILIQKPDSTLREIVFR